MTRRGLEMGALVVFMALGCARGGDAPGASGTNGVSSTAGADKTAATGPSPADEYTNDLDRICHSRDHRQVG